MMRYIPLDYEETGANFAFFSTITDTFYTFNDTQTWAHFNDFLHDYLADQLFPELASADRFKALVPKEYK